jgi:hypothetical protein
VKKVFLICVVVFLSISGSVQASTLFGDLRIRSDRSISGVDFEQTTDFQGTWRTGGSDGVRVILSGVMNTNIEIGGLSLRDLRKSDGFSEKGFEIRRDAGTFFFDGSLSASGKGSGRFSFRPDPAYAEKMRFLLSPDSARREALSGETVFFCAVHDLSYDFARTMLAVGYQGMSLDKLLILRSSREIPEFVKALVDKENKAGSSDSLLALRALGVKPEYIEALGKIGYRNVSPDDLILLAVQKVPTDFIKSVIGTSDNLPTLRELTLIWMYGDKVSEFKNRKRR